MKKAPNLTSITTKTVRGRLMEDVILSAHSALRVKDVRFLTWPWGKPIIFADASCGITEHRDMTRGLEVVSVFTRFIRQLRKPNMDPSAGELAMPGVQVWIFSQKAPQSAFYWWQITSRKRGISWSDNQQLRKFYSRNLLWKSQLTTLFQLEGHSIFHIDDSGRILLETRHHSSQFW